jgi:actin-like ATPase involved in cell morphogenesis
VLVGGAPLAPELLMARLLRWVVDQVATSEGRPPESITVTHPANWGTYKLDLLRAAINHVGFESVRFLPEPVAAATFYASQRELAPGSVVAVYDLGGGTFDAAVVRRTDTGFEIAGRPEGIDRLGGIDFDHAVFNHVLASIGEQADRLDADEPGMVAAVSQLREECVEAKEALSTETDVDIAVLLPGRQTEVRLTRSEFETMIRPAINETIVALRRAVASARVEPEAVSAVLLVGGSSRIPLVGQMVTADLGRPVAVDARPKDAIALGAALDGGRPAPVLPQPGPPVAAWPTAAVQPTPAPAAPPVGPQPGAPAPIGQPPMGPPSSRPHRRRAVVLAVLAVFVLLAGGLAAWLLTRPDESEFGGGATTSIDFGGTILPTIDTSDTGGTETTVAAGSDATLPGLDWGPDAEAAFVDDCANPSSGLPGLPEDDCHCIYGYVSTHADFDEFNQQSIDWIEGGRSFLDYPQVLLDAASECGADAPS